MTIPSAELKEEANSHTQLRAEVPLCRVCQRGYDGSQHFGIEVCRACAAFFRRAVEGQKKFVCRKGGDRCQLNAPRKVTCQKCRFVKCLKVGLLPELVQCKRSSRDSEINHSETRDSAASTSEGAVQEKPSLDIIPAVSFSSDVNFTAKNIQALCSLPINKPEIRAYGRLLGDVRLRSYRPHPQAIMSVGVKNSTIFRPIPTINPVYSLDSAGTRPNLIHRVLRNYRKMYAERWAMEIETPGSEDAPKFCAVGKVFSLISLSRLSTIMRKQLAYISRFIHETFDDYALFDASEKQMILQLFMTCFWELEGSYWTYRNLPAQHIDKMMLTLTTYSDLNNLEYLIMMDKEPRDICLLKEVITSLQKHIRATLINQMRSFILSEVEFVALLTLSLWSQRNLRGHEKAERVASNYRAQIFYDLHEHYREERKMDNYANRFGDLMCLFVDAQLNATRIGEDIELLKLFNMYNVDAFVYDCLSSGSKRPSATVQ